jgi:5'(3')-deoxyribonucleotidase
MIDYFLDRQNLEYERRKKDIENSTSYTEERKQELLAQLEVDTPRGETLENLANNFAIYQCNKEVKHYKSWEKGKREFKYKGSTFPVMTQNLVSDKDILEIEQFVKDGLEV